jgi:hypothetical protein
VTTKIVQNSSNAVVLVPIATGELVDKITVLEIKSERILDRAKQANILHELELLRRVRDDHLPADDAIIALTHALKRANEKIWDLEDQIRECERQADFSEHFIATARAIYQTNDERSRIKREINHHLGSTIIEEKSYTDYSSPKPSKD